MSIGAGLAADPAELMGALGAGDVVAPFDLLDADSTVGAVGKVAILEPVSHLLSQCFLTVLLCLVDFPGNGAAATELEPAVGALS